VAQGEERRGAARRGQVAVGRSWALLGCLEVQSHVCGAGEPLGSRVTLWHVVPCYCDADVIVTCHKKCCRPILYKFA